MKISNLKGNLCQGWGDLWMLPFRAKRIRCLVPLARDASGCVWGKTAFSGIQELCESF